MAAESTCGVCGGHIAIADHREPADHVAVADQFFHTGCIEVNEPRGGRTVPAYLIPRRW